MTTTYAPNPKGPVRFENLWPGSYFTLVHEPSRKIRNSKDARVYRKAFDGFYAEHPETKAGCCLRPEDIVLPHRKINGKGK